MSQVLSPPTQLDVSKCIPDYLPRHKVASSPAFFSDLGNLVPVTSPIHSDSPAGSVDDDNSSSHSPRSAGQFQRAEPRPSAAFNSPVTSPTTDMFDPNSRPSFVAAQYPAHNLPSINSAADTLRNSDAVGSYLSESPSPVDVHRPPSFPHPISAPPSQDRFPLTGAPSYSGEDRTIPESLADRCVRQGPHDKYSNVDSNSVLDQRRMSEPAVHGSPSPYPPGDSNDRLSQYPFAFNPPPPQPSRSSSYASSLHRNSSLGSLRDTRGNPDYPLSQSHWKQGDEYEQGLYEPISPLNPNFPNGLLGSPNGVPYSPPPGDPYGPSPPNTGTSTSSAPPLGSMNYGNFGSQSQMSSLQRGTNTNANLAGDANNKTYSFVALPGNTVKKRPRRRYDEIERLYQCSWPDCTKSYGTLNHLNAHVTMQKHGPKRTPSEFKELRKQWRKAKKEAEAVGLPNGSARRIPNMRPDESGSYDTRYGSMQHRQHPAMGLSVNVPHAGSANRFAVPIEDIRYPPHEREDDVLHYGSLRRFNNVGTPSSWHAGSNLASRAGFSQSYMSSSLPSAPSHPSSPSPRTVGRLGPDSTLLTPLSGYQNHQSHPGLLPPLHPAGELPYPPDSYDLYESDSRPGTGHASIGGHVSGDDFDHRG